MRIDIDMHYILWEKLFDIHMPMDGVQAWFILFVEACYYYHEKCIYIACVQTLGRA